MFNSNASVVLFKIESFAMHIHMSSVCLKCEANVPTEHFGEVYFKSPHRIILYRMELTLIYLLNKILKIDYTSKDA